MQQPQARNLSPGWGRWECAQPCKSASTSPPSPPVELIILEHVLPALALLPLHRSRHGNPAGRGRVGSSGGANKACSSSSSGGSGQAQAQAEEPLPLYGCMRHSGHTAAS